jgi:ELWxxDGT repeat protein
MRCQTLANLCTFLALAGQVHSQTWLTYDINLKSRIPASSGIEPGTEGQGGIAWTQRRFVQANGRFFFVAKGPLGAELYSSSGAPGSTRLVKDICPGAASSDPMHLQAAGQLVYFMASNGTHGRELWVSDGSETGTRLVKDIEPGIASSSSSELCAVGQKLIFAVTTRSGATELWISDGSSVGTQRLKVIHPSAGGKLRHTASFGSLVVFAAEDSTHGEEPWISDGTASGTMLLKECMPGSLGGSPTGFHDLGNGLCLFSALAGGAGRELWVTDGTSAGTTLLKDIRPGSRAGLAFSDTLCDGAVINSRLFFPADDGVNGWALWVSDGSAAGTQMLRAFPLGSSTRQSLGSIYPAAGRAWFGAEEPNLGQQPWVSDGTTSGTVRLGLTNAAGPSDPWGFASVGSGSLVVFSARGGTSLGRELWITDGTANAATLLKDIHPGATSSDARYLTPLANGQVAFRAANPDVGSELWKTDGTSSGTQVLGNIAPEMGYGSYPKNMLRFWERTLFSATDGYSGREPWAFDFTPRNLQQLMDIRVGSSSSYFDYPVRLAGR